MKELITHPLALPVVLFAIGLVVMAITIRDLMTGRDEKYITEQGYNLSVVGFYVGLALTVAGGGWLAWITLFA